MTPTTISIIGGLMSLVAALFAWSAKRGQGQADTNTRTLVNHGEKLAVLEERQRVGQERTAERPDLEDIRRVMREEVSPLRDDLRSLQQEIHSHNERILAVELTSTRQGYVNGGGPQ